MAKRHGVLAFVTVCLLLVPDLACSESQPSQVTPTQSPNAVPLPTSTSRRVIATEIPATATPILVSPTPTATIPPSDPALTDVQFALEVDQTGKLTFPATEFVSGVTRVYVRFAYQNLADISEVESGWFLNGNRVSRSRLAWDGGADGEYLIWIEDPDGLARGQWQWEMLARGERLGSGTFTIGGEPRYINETWGLSFDPPAAWSSESETADYVTFASPDQRQALALFVTSGTGLSEVAAANLELFREDHSEAEVVLTEDATMNGEPALLQQVAFSDQEGVEQFLFIVSALRTRVGYSLWVLGPADDIKELKSLLADALLSIRFSSGN